MTFQSEIWLIFEVYYQQSEIVSLYRKEYQFHQQLSTLDEKNISFAFKQVALSFDNLKKERLLRLISFYPLRLMIYQYLNHLLLACNDDLIAYQHSFLVELVLYLKLILSHEVFLKL